MNKKLSQRIGAGLMEGLCAVLSVGGSFPAASAALLAALVLLIALMCAAVANM